MKKFSFEVYSAADIVLLSNIKSSFYNKKDIKRLTFNTINIFYIIPVVFKFLYNLIIEKNFKESFNIVYLKHVINIINPKVVIGDDLDNRIFKIKKIFPKIKTICYQFSFIIKDEINAYKKILKNKEVDYFIVFNKKMKNLVSNIFNAKKTKIYIGGSVRNNEQKILKHKKIYDILFISEFRDLSYLKKNISSSAFKNFKKRFIDSEIFFKKISKYCERKKLKLCVALASNRKDKSFSKRLKKLESDYFLRINQKINFDNETAYFLAFKSKIIASNYSNLGYELQAMNLKVFFHQFIKNNFNKEFEDLFKNKKKKSNINKDYQIPYKKNKVILNDIIKNIIKK